MRIAYCTNVRLPTERAHGHQIAHVCNALDLLGHEVTVLAPYRLNTVQQSYHEFYRARKAVKVRQLGTFDPINHPLTPGVVGLWTLNWLLRRQLTTVLATEAFDCLYTRSPALLHTLLATGKPVILELHRLPSRGRRAFVRRCNSCALVVCLTSRMKAELVRWGVREEKVIVEGDAFEPAQFMQLPTSKQAKKELHLTSHVPVIGYVGQLTSMGLSKGVPELMGALVQLNERGIPFQALIAGGPDEARRQLQDALPQPVRTSIHFLGWVAHEQVPHVLAACDILVYPAPKSDHPYYQRDVSPLKIFEYMAAERSVVCADLPPLRDVVDESVVEFCTPGDAASCANAIARLISDPARAHTLAKAAHARVQRHTWEQRMKRIMDAAHIAV